ncbi:MBL fold metallo-hydrolase [Cohnella herbarum]|uniref:MBL fold metallo-hydrolase n=1 Tax=Cohnella herbarum TaxID=2728023 RepID=A0A7Z2VR33_9BACL|nr:MBL fold metallo-hydrolase [Cohnella herbarum]QJD87654.1 MBL fold metallo-hydrolase [Cohnella herbarum]
MTKTTEQPINMTAQKVTRAIIDRQPLFILDVRNTADYEDWKIEGGSIEDMNVPYFDLLDGVDKVLPLLPANRKVLVVCAKEGSSQFVAEQLVEAGRTDIHYLQGGMKAWSEHLEPVKIGGLHNGGELYQFVRMGKGCLSYMILSEGEAVVVDPLRMTKVFEDFAQQRGVRIRHALDTHLHADHISGGRMLAENNGAIYWLPPKDAEEVTFAYEALEEGKEIKIGNARIKIQPIYSPGHTIGSTSIIVDDQYLLSGDILFVESIGRPDLAGSAGDWAEDLRSTLYDKYSILSEDLIVLPAHFGKINELGKDGSVSARLGDLFANNPGLNIDNQDTFRQAVTTNLPAQPNAYQEIRKTNMGIIQPDDEEKREMEIGPNRCAIHDK